MATELNETYKVTANHIKLSVIIGDAQIGSSIAKIDGTTISRGDIIAVDIGKGSDLSGKKLFIKTIVTDVNDLTDMTSVTIRLGDGVEKKEFVQNQLAAEPGGSVVYRCFITFVQ